MKLLIDLCKRSLNKEFGNNMKSISNKRQKLNNETYSRIKENTNSDIESFHKNEIYEKIKNLLR